MRTVTSLAEVTTFLENHENSQRIKKLIFSICKNQWENDLNKIDQTPLPHLIQQLYNLHPSLDKLTQALNRTVKTLNKSKEYTLVAEVILHHFTPLYRISEEPTQLLNYPAVNPAKLPTAYNPFHLRLAVMQFTNPLRAKILLFSVLNRPFQFNSQDWLDLKSIELDTLLLNVFRSCETLSQLEEKLKSTAQKVNHPEENLQSVGSILQSLTPLYSQRQDVLNQISPYYHHPAELTKLMLRQPSEELSEILDEDDDEGESTCQFFPV